MQQLQNDSWHKSSSLSLSLFREKEKTLDRQVLTANITKRLSILGWRTESVAMCLWQPSIPGETDITIVWTWWSVNNMSRRLLLSFHFSIPYWFLSTLLEKRVWKRSLHDGLWGQEEYHIKRDKEGSLESVADDVLFLFVIQSRLFPILSQRSILLYSRYNFRQKAISSSFSSWYHWQTLLPASSRIPTQERLRSEVVIECWTKW